MKLIADSGSTKTDWRLIDKAGHFQQYNTDGMNPNFTSGNDLVKICLDAFPGEVINRIDEVWFYGAGCGSEVNRKRVEAALKACFLKSEVYVTTDILGAARALCGNEPGIAAILGTGMNSCVYNGFEIVQNHFSLGYILGDEGSGAYLGKTFIKHYLNDTLPAEMVRNFEHRYQLNKQEIIEAIYRKPFPNRFLAQFAKFLYQNLKNAFVEELVINNFRDFLRTQIMTYPQYGDHKLHLTGSVAFYFSNLLRRVATDEGIKTGTIIERPIAALALYHSS